MGVTEHRGELKAAYVLAVLTLIGVVNWIDRSIVAILVDPIEKDLHATDTMMGLLNSFGFALWACLPTPSIPPTARRRCATP